MVNNMKMTKQLAQFVQRINRELKAYEREQSISSIKEMNHNFCVGIKDTLYLLGTSYGEEYEWARGFEKFCREIGIDWELLQKL